MNLGGTLRQIREVKRALLGNRKLFALDLDKVSWEEGLKIKFEISVELFPEDDDPEEPEKARRDD